MRKRIAILTATRAEYGLLSPVIKRLMEYKDIDVQVVVTGMHLSPEFGYTYREIEQDGVPIDKKIEILMNSDTPSAISKSMGLAMIGFGEYFAERKPDALLVLGDRYETMAVCCAAMNAGIPIFHIHGGETTEGAIDEAIRHSITKMSYLHFTATEAYRKRVIQLGETPDRVHNVGAVGVENALNTPLLSKEELEKSLCFSFSKPYVVVTFHPVTLEPGESEAQCSELLKVFEDRQDLNFIFTKANADAEGRCINRMLEEYAQGHPGQAALYDSLGKVRYLSAVRYAKAVMGNSSSGIVEVPTFRVPTINIGSRQRGRIQAGSIINCEPEHKSIEAALSMVDTADFQKALSIVENPYEKQGTSQQIADIIRKSLSEYVDLKKKFYDLLFDYRSN